MFSLETIFPEPVNYTPKVDFSQYHSAELCIFYGSKKPFQTLFFEFVWTMIWTGFLTAAFRNGLSPFHHESTAQFAEGASWFGLDSVFTVRVMRAGIEDPESAFPFDHVTFAAGRTLDTT